MRSTTRCSTPLAASRIALAIAVRPELPWAITASLEVVGADGLDGGGKSDADEGTSRGRIHDGGHDADDLAIHVDQRPAGVARIGGGIKLNQASQNQIPLGVGELAVQARDHASGGRWPHAEGKTDHRHGIARHHLTARAQGGRLQIVGNFLRFEDRQIVVGLSGHDFGFRLGAICKRHHQPGGSPHHMQIGQDHAVLVDDHACAHTRLQFLSLAFGIGRIALHPDHRACDGFKGRSCG